jgi:serine/threonine protein kinase
MDRLKAALADRYAVHEELGAGGMATVYLAEDLKHDRKVAIKVLRPELAAVLGAERFLKFARPRVIFRGPYINVAWRSHDLAPDGRRHLVVLGPLEQSTNRLHVITNWVEEVARMIGQ